MQCHSVLIKTFRMSNVDYAICEINVLTSEHTGLVCTHTGTVKQSEVYGNLDFP